MDFFHSQEALLAYGADQFQDARKALDKVGGRMVKHGVFLVNAGDVDLAIARTYALTGPLAAQVQAMEKADHGGVWCRWAVVCSREIQKTPLGDLLTAELSKAPGLELVERDEMSKTAAELELAQLLGAQNADGRLKLGRRVPHWPGGIRPRPEARPAVLPGGNAQNPRLVA